MRVYRVGWLIFCGLLGLVGAAAALTWSLQAIVMLFICAAFTGGVVAWVALDPEDTTVTPEHRRRTVLTCTVLAGIGSVAFIGLGTLLGAPMAVLLMAIAAGGSPHALRAGLRWLEERPASPERLPEPPETTTDTTSPEPQAAPNSLSDLALCLAWRASFAALQRAESLPERLRIVEERQAYLDELERRNATGLGAWLASGARAAGNPGRFVLNDRVVGQTEINWDGLIHGTDK